MTTEAPANPIVKLLAYLRARIVGKPAAPKLKPAEAEIERLAADRAKRDGTTRQQAYANVLTERPELYEAYIREVKP